MSKRKTPYRSKVKIGVDAQGKDIVKYIQGYTRAELDQAREAVIARYITGEALADDIAAIKREYYRLAAAGKPEFDVETAEKTFTDVAPDKWYTKAILWAANQNPAITAGNTDGTFGINAICNTAHMLTFLYAQQGKPAYDAAEVPEGYVSAGKWYTEAASWAYVNGIYRAESGQFSQHVSCTRATTVLYIYRAMTGLDLAE